MNVPHYVYRCYDAADRLLYIGCTQDMGGRMAVHASSWQNPASAALNLRMARHTVEEFPSKDAARAAERAAIFNEAPLFNLHHQREKKSPADRYAFISAYVELTRPPMDPEFAAHLGLDAS
jgi:predicted GIY-YIG superfamily endonuclease